MCLSLTIFEIKPVICRKSPIMTHPTCIWRPHRGWSRLNFAEIFGCRKLESIVWCCLCDPTFSHFSRTPTCDRHRHRETDTGPWLVPLMHSIARLKLKTGNAANITTILTCISAYTDVRATKTTASILTKFCTMIDTTKYSSWVVQICALLIPDDGRPLFWKPLNRDISTTIWPILRKFLRDGAYLSPTAHQPLKFPIFKNPKWRRPPYWKIAKLLYLSNGLTDHREIWPDDTEWAICPLAIPANKKNWISKIQDGGRPPFWKRLNHNIFTAYKMMLTKFCKMMHTGPCNVTIFRTTKVHITNKQALHRSNAWWSWPIREMSICMYGFSNQTKISDRIAKILRKRLSKIFKNVHFLCSFLHVISCKIA